MCSGPLYYLGAVCEVLLPPGAPILDRLTAWLHAFPRRYAQPHSALVREAYLLTLELAPMTTLVLL